MKALIFYIPMVRCSSPRTSYRNSLLRFDPPLSPRSFAPCLATPVARLSVPIRYSYYCRPCGGVSGVGGRGTGGASG